MGKANIVKNKFYSIFVVILITIMSFFGFSINISTQSYAEEIQSTISINVNFQRPHLSDVVLENRTFTQILLPDCISQAMPGDPALPVYSSQILIPNGKEVIDISVSYRNSINIDCDIANKPIVPQQEMVPFSSNNRGRPFAMNKTAYNKFTPVNNKLYRDGGTGFCRGFEILTVYLYPVIYRPKTGELSYIPQMKISVELKGDEHSKLGAGLEKRNDFLRCSDNDKRAIKDMVINPESISTYEPPVAGRLGGDAPLDGGGEPGGTDSPLDGGESPLDYSGGLCDPADSYNYVIISNNALKYTTGYTYNWSDLIDHRQSYSGLSGTIVTVEEIDACVEYWNDTALFNDSQAHIREFCKDAYEDWGTEYILLGGDWDATASHQIVPYRLFTDRYETETFNTMACDMYYSHLDGDWYYSGSGGMWGGGKTSGVNDPYGELYIGRITAYDASMVSNAINKIINYDTNESLSDAWLSTCSFWGGDLGWSATSKQYMEELRLGTDTYRIFTGFEEWNAAHPNDEIDTSERLYHADIGATYKQYFHNSVEDDNASIINHLDHSSYNTPFGLTSWQFKYNTKPFFGYSQGCLAGRFHSGYAGCEQMMCRHPERHAFALVLNTGYGYGSTSSTNGASQYVNAYFWDYFFGNQSDNLDNWQLGKAMLYARNKIAGVVNSHSHAWCYAWYSTHLFGDPAQTLRIGDANSNMVVLSNENPSDGSNDVPISIPTLSVTMTDPTGSNFNWSIETSPNIGSNSANGASNGSKSCTISGLSYSKTYHWFVNVTDGNSWTNESFSFTTEDEPVNNPPVFSSHLINNGTTEISIELSSLSITIQDPEGESFNWTIETSPNIGSKSGNGESNGTKSCSISGLDYFTSYTWYVNATDGNSWTREWYTFITRSTYTPDAPGSFSAVANGRFQIDLSWIDDTKTDSTRVEWHTSSDVSWNIGDHVLLYNGSSESVSQSGLNPVTSRYYKAWSWNETDKLWSSGVTDDATTVSNNAPIIGSPNPSNGSTGIDISLTWSVSVTDTDVDTFDWSIECSNGQTNSGTDDSDGIKQLSVSGLDYSSMYTVWVNITDGFDWTRDWFTFETVPAEDNSPPLISNVAIASSSPMDVVAGFGWENITCSVTDNGTVSRVFLNITHPDGSTTNVSMSNIISTDVYCYNTSFLQYGNYSYFIWSNDTSTNSDKSNIYDFSMAPNWDVNKDGYCNVLDINLISNRYKESGSAGWIREDIDNNGEIQILDFVFVSDHYGESWWV